jgi:hypothetical protein
LTTYTLLALGKLKCNCPRENETKQNRKPQGNGQALGLNPEEILTKEALSMPHRTVVTADRHESQMETLLKALKHKLKKELAETPIPAPKTV